MRKRRKRRRSVKWAAVLWTLTILNVGVGLAFSPVTAAGQARVEGAPDFDHARLSRILKKLQDIPCVRVNGYEVETRALDLPEVKSAHLSRNIFRRAVLELEYRRPVARVFGLPGVALSSVGVMYRSQLSLKGLPLLKIPPAASTAWLSFCGGAKGEALSYVCERIKSLDQFRDATVEVDSKGSVYLHNGFGARVKIGPSERMDLKLDKLEEILRERPDLLRRVKELNLISPSRAVIVPRTEGATP